MKRWAWWIVGVAVGVMAVFVLAKLRSGTEGPGQPMPAPPDRADGAARGAYLARAGNCGACHTERGGAIGTPFGTVYASNLTPDPGLDAWSRDDFWRARRPFGMPPFATVLSDADVAAVLSHIRASWGNAAGAVSELTVAQQRSTTC